MDTLEKVAMYEAQLAQLWRQAEEGSGLGRPYSQVFVQHLEETTKDLNEMAQAINPDDTPELRFLVRRIRVLMDEMIELQLRVSAIVAAGKKELDS